MYIPSPVRRWDLNCTYKETKSALIRRAEDRSSTAVRISRGLEIYLSFTSQVAFRSDYEITLFAYSFTPTSDILAAIGGFVVKFNYLIKLKRFSL